MNNQNIIKERESEDIIEFPIKNNEKEIKNHNIKDINNESFEKRKKNIKKIEENITNKMISSFLNNIKHKTFIENRKDKICLENINSNDSPIENINSNDSPKEDSSIDLGLIEDFSIEGCSKDIYKDSPINPYKKDFNEEIFMSDDDMADDILYEKEKEEKNKKKNLYNNIEMNKYLNYNLNINKHIRKDILSEKLIYFINSIILYPHNYLKQEDIQNIFNEMSTDYEFAAVEFIGKYFLCMKENIFKK